MLPAGICTYVAHQHDEGHRPAGHGIIRDLSFPLGPKGGNSLTASSKTLHLFGIKACDTMKKARTWLDEHGATNEKLPDGSFMDPSLPVNTGVSARMVVIDILERLQKLPPR